MRRIGITLLLCLAGCADYRFTVNDKVVYTPVPLFTDYTLADVALEECVRQHILDRNISAAESLIDLNCSHAGISDLSGIEVFNGLVRLKLANNRIVELAPLSEMDTLRELRLDGNQLRGLRDIHGLVKLELLDLRDNPALPCSELTVFRSRATVTLVAPERCGSPGG